MENAITSQKLNSFFTKTNRDDYVFELTDYPGIQIIRKYPATLPSFQDKRMFIKFVLINESDVWYVGGGVDTVKNKQAHESGWTIEYPLGLLLQKPTNYSFWKAKDARFNILTNIIDFKNKKYTLDQFISLLEKNHLRDMFLLNRLWNYLKLVFLHILFFFSDSRFKKFEHIFKREERTSILKEEKVKSASEKADPLFHYFYIYKNLFGITILVMLPILFTLSICLPEEYFTVSNPFLLSAALFLFFLLEKLSDLLFYLLTGTDFVQKVTRSALESRGSLRAY